MKDIFFLANYGDVNNAKNRLRAFFHDEIIVILNNPRRGVGGSLFNNFLSAAHYCGDIDIVFKFVDELKNRNMLSPGFRGILKNIATQFLWSGWVAETCLLLREIGEWHGLQARRADRYISSISEINGKLKRLLSSSEKFVAPILSKKSRYKIFMHNASSDSSNFRYFSNDIRKLLSEKYDIIIGVEEIESDIADQYYVLTGKMSDQEFYDFLVTQDVDIFLDFCGENRGCRFAALSRRPVPIAITYCGLTASGNPGYNYRLVDSYISQPSGLLEWSNETLLVHPTVFSTYAPPYDAPDIQPRNVEGPIVFGNISQLPKISSETIRLWSKILHAVPKSHLLLKQKYLSIPGARWRLQEFLMAQGISADRVLFQGETSHADHLDTLNSVDIYLDTAPFGGHTTCCEAMWMGKPVVNLLGDSMVMGRLSGSFVHAAGYPAWTAKTADEYVAIAVELARQPDELARLRRDLRGEMIRSSLCDGRRWVREFTALLDDLLARLTDEEGG